ncbi:MAG: hypothetical protein RLZZ577_1212 [Bacteroidota bacterium]|jgi:hypothetical protein
MENLKNEIATLQKGIEALAVVMENYKSAVEILSIKLEEVQADKIEVCPVKIADIIENYFDDILPYSVDMDWSDGSFQASCEIDLHEVLKNELPYNWAGNMAERIVSQIQDENK